MRRAIRLAGNELDAALITLGDHVDEESRILVAAGRGERLGLDRPKVFANLGDEPLLAVSLRRLEACPWVDAIVAFWRRDRPSFPNYAAGTWGPPSSDELLRRDGRSWRRH